jgi:hypothetical protein
MKLCIISVYTFFLLTAVSISNAGTAADAVRTLEKNSYYFKPLATVFGTINSSGWYRSAGVDKVSALVDYLSSLHNSKDDVRLTILMSHAANVWENRTPGVSSDNLSSEILGGQTTVYRRVSH